MDGRTAHRFPRRSEGQVEFAVLGGAERRPVAASEMGETTSVFDEAESRAQPGVDPAR